MRCPACGAVTFVKETRGTRRRRECFNGHRFSTKEVLADAAPELQRQARYEQGRAVLKQRGILA